MVVSGNVGLSLRVVADVDDPDDEDAVEDALAQAGVDALKEQYGVDIRLKDVIVFDSGEGFDDE